MFRIGSIASGMGMHLHGLKQVGGVPAWAIECSRDIAQVYRMNHSGRLYVKRVEEVNPSELPDIDCLIATLSCKHASIAQGANWGEVVEDVAAGVATAEIIKTKLPSVFLLENVWRYRKFQSFRHIEKALSECGYYVRIYHLNCADWGIAQSRLRLYCVAVRGGAFWDITPPQCRQVGWYEAISDLIPTLPETQLAPWQKTKFPQLDETCLIPDHSSWTSLIPVQKPAGTVRAGHQTFKALIKRVGGGRDSDRIYHPNEPAFTIRAFGGSGHSVPGTAMADSKIVAITPRACLRFFGDKETADSIWLPSTRAMAMEVVGNGASWVMFQMLIEHIGVFANVAA